MILARETWHAGLALFFVMALGCKKTDEPFRSGRPDAKVWTISKENVVDAGIGKDGIPSVDEPRFSLAHEVNGAFDDELVLGLTYDGKQRAYPMPMLNWHEIVNDDVYGLPIAITYCPLTGTGIGWSRLINGAETSFGVSGLLFNSNLMPYDRLTNSTWSQQKLECVNGLFIGERPKTHTLIETSFKTWRATYPNSEVMNAETGFVRRYAEYPYGTYRTNHEQLFFPITHEDQRLPKKERVLGVIEGGEVMTFQFNEPGSPVAIVEAMVGGAKIFVVRSYDLQILTAFYSGGRKFTPVQNDLPIIFQDERGNLYDLGGQVRQGPNRDEVLEQPVAFLGFWFSWAAFYPEVRLYKD